MGSFDEVVANTKRAIFSQPKRQSCVDVASAHVRSTPHFSPMRSLRARAKRACRVLEHSCIGGVKLSTAWLNDIPPFQVSKNLLVDGQVEQLSGIIAKVLKSFLPTQAQHLVWMMVIVLAMLRVSQGSGFHSNVEALSHSVKKVQQGERVDPVINEKGVNVDR